MELYKSFLNRNMPLQFILTCTVLPFSQYIQLLRQKTEQMKHLVSTGKVVDDLRVLTGNGPVKRVVSTDSELTCLVSIVLSWTCFVICD